MIGMLSVGDGVKVINTSKMFLGCHIETLNHLFVNVIKKSTDKIMSKFTKEICYMNSNQYSLYGNDH